MDGLADGPASVTDVAGAMPFLPPDAPIAMPEQSLHGPQPKAPPIAVRPRALLLRRAFILLITLAMTAVAAEQMYLVLSVSTLTILESIVLVLFVILFAWIAFSSASALIGFALSLFGRDRALDIDPNVALPALSGRHALLTPTYNETPSRVMARLQAIYESVAECGRLSHFDFFLLSDTTDPDIWLQEEAQYLALLARTKSDQIFYRHRRENTARKAGNIAEWVRRFGGALPEHADARRRQPDGRRHHRAPRRGHGAEPACRPDPDAADHRQWHDSLFARLQQFARRALRADAGARHRLVARHRRQLLGPQRHHPGQARLRRACRPAACCPAASRSAATS